MTESKKHILTVALNLFLQKSYKEVTMKEIVQSTGLSKGAFYHYFTSKEELFTEIINTFCSSFMMIDYTQFDQTNLYRFYNGYLRYIMTRMRQLAEELDIDTVNKTVNFYFLLFTGVNIIPDLRQRVTRLHDLELAQWTNVVKEARKRGEIRSGLSNADIAKLFIRSADGIGIEQILRGSLEPIETEVKRLWNAIYGSVKA